MNEGKVNKFLRVYREDKNYKLFLDDLLGIYRLRPRKTPPLKPYQEQSADLSEETSSDIEPTQMDNTGAVRSM